MIKVLMVIFILISGIFIFLNENSNQSVDVLAENKAPITQGAQLFLENKAHSYELFHSEAIKKVAKKESSLALEHINSIKSTSEYSHQPTENVGTNNLNIDDGTLPSEVLPGVEFIEFGEKAYFTSKNEGRFISVTPNQKPMLVKDLVIKQQNINN